MESYPHWVKKYVELSSDLLSSITKEKLAHECNVDRTVIYRYFKTNPNRKIDIDKLIYSNIKAQKHVLGSLAFTQLCKVLQKASVPLIAIKLALIVSGDYVEKTDNVSRYANMNNVELDEAISNIIRRQKSKQIEA